MILVHAVSKAGGHREGGTVRTLLTVLIGCLTLSTMLFVALTLRLKSTQTTEATADRISDTAEMRKQIDRMQTQVAHLAEQIDGLQPSICQKFGNEPAGKAPIVAVSPPYQLNDADRTSEWDAPKPR